MKKTTYIYLLALLFTVATGYSQNLKEKISKENLVLLKELSEEDNQRSIRIKTFLDRNNDYRKAYVDNLGRYIEIYDVKDGKPIYFATDNVNAATATKTNSLQSGGSLGLSLDGSDMTVGVWDGGPVQEDHPEFTDGSGGSRVTIIDNSSSSGDGVPENHATHVTGTIAARGIEPAARGMANNVKVKSYNWTNDRTEVLEAILDASVPIILSNHSYGVPIETEDDGKIDSWRPGAYSAVASSWDQLLYNNPQYLMVTSAGNSGTVSYDGGLAPGFDKLTGNTSSKNNLVVANANPTTAPFSGDLTNLVINPSSSQGPTDDLRVKPDLAADGTNLLSSVTNNEYDTYTGTSMSSPNAMGSLVLLQELYKNIHGKYMLASTLKGLVCHTAIDDNANEGPDPKFGWGFLNIYDAAVAIEDNSSGLSVIEETVLAQGTTYSITFNAQQGSKIMASISWTDLPGAAVEGQLNNNNPVLINDLDLRIKFGENTFMPWKLNYTGSDFFADKGDNIVDNLEKIDLIAPETGEYTLTVSHKGTLQGTGGGPFDVYDQVFSIIVTGANITLGTTDLNADSMKIFPNPAKDFIDIAFKNKSSSNFKFKIYDTNSRLIMDDITPETYNSSRVRINVSRLQTGFYLLEVNNGLQKYFHKIVIK